MSAKYDVFELTKHFEDEEMRFTCILDLLNNLYASTKEEFKKKVTKTFVTQIIEIYSHENSKFRTDPRLLRAWDLLGQTSNSLGYEAVMQKLDDLGYFKNCPEFYRLWASHLAEKKDRASFDKLHARVASIFPRNKSILDVFVGYAKQFGPKVPLDDDVTENVFDKLGSTPSYRPPAPPLAVLSEESERSSSSSKRSISSNDIQSTFVVDPTPTKSASTFSAAAPVVSDPIPSSKAPAANYSFTTHLHRDAVCAFGETLPLSQEAIPPAPVSISRLSKNAEKDFSVFAEDEEEAMDTRQAPPSPVYNHLLSHPSIRDSPLMKKSRTRRDSDEELEPSYDNPFGDVGGFKKQFSGLKTVFDSDKVVIDDPTIAGLDKQQTSSRAASTPTGGKHSVPSFEVSPTATFPSASNKENQPFTFAPAVGPADIAKSPQQPKRSTLPPLSEAISRMSLAPPADDLDATTHDLSIMPEEEIKSGINPWSEKERVKVLEQAPPMVEQHEFLTTKAPIFNTKGATVELGGEKFKIIKFIAQGGFARIYKTQAEDGKKYAIKLEMPSCPWEVYVCKSLSVRLPPQIQPFVMSIRDAYIFSNASAIVYDFYPLKTLLDLANAYKQDKMDGMLVAFVGIQIAEILNYVHQAQIVHSDIKPDNFVIVEPMSSELPHLHYLKPFVKLIDWGRAIDMSFYPDQTFKGRAGTNGFDCHEMLEDRPWTYQTDYFGFVGTMHVLMFNSYMKSFFNPAKKVYSFTEQLKRRYPLYETWSNIFREFLNIPNCNSMPSWENVVVQLKQDLEDFATEDVSAWRRAVDKCNAILRNYGN